MLEPNAAPLVPVARRGPRRGIIAAVARVLVLVGVLGAMYVMCTPTELDCETARHTAAVAVVVCQREYERTRSPRAGMRLAVSLQRSGNGVAARAVASELLIYDEVRADALQLLGEIAGGEGRTDEGIELVEQARALHRAANQRADLAWDNQILAGLQLKRSDFAGALHTLEECIDTAGDVDDRTLEVYCRLSSANVLHRVGQFEASQAELERAAPLLSSDRDRTTLYLEKGNLAQELVRGPRRAHHHKEAIEWFGRALESATRAGLPKQVRNARSNLAYSLAEDGQTDEAARQLEEARRLDLDGKYESPHDQLAARIAYRRGSLAVAWSINERIYTTIEDHDDRLEVAVMQARIALANGDLAAAERWAQRGVEDAEELRRPEASAELRPWILATRREPYELWFVARARAGRIEEAFLAFARWQSRTVADSLARPSARGGATLASTAIQVSELQRLLPVVAAAQPAGDDRAAIEALRGPRAIDLLALAVADGEVWRLVASRGRLRIERLGSFEAIGDQRDDLIGAPRDRAAAVADALGALILPEDLVRDTGEPLHVVLDAPLATLPFVALRRDGRPVIDARPVLRVPRIPAATTSCAPRPVTGGALVLADAEGNLPDARSEGNMVASLFGATPLVGAAAKRAALLAAKPGSLLHVAVHAGIGTGGGTLKLYDETVSALEIAANRIGPALVVLSACATTQANDPELAGALSTAFLIGGSARVVATLRPITDAGALEVMRRFYARGGAQDPVRVLAQVQAELAATDNADWTNFVVFGTDACAPRS